MSDSCTKPSDDIIDILVCVVDLDKRINKNNYKEKELTIEKIKSICQELLLRLHPDKKSPDSADTDSSKDSENSEFSNVLTAWKFLSKYSNVNGNDAAEVNAGDDRGRHVLRPHWKPHARLGCWRDSHVSKEVDSRLNDVRLSTQLVPPYSDVCW